MHWLLFYFGCFNDFPIFSYDRIRVSGPSACVGYEALSSITITIWGLFWIYTISGITGTWRFIKLLMDTDDLVKLSPDNMWEATIVRYRIIYSSFASKLHNIYRFRQIMYYPQHNYSSNDNEFVSSRLSSNSCIMLLILLKDVFEVTSVESTELKSLFIMGTVP